MPNPQIYASIVAGNPAAPTQLYVAIVDASGNIIGSTFTQPQGRLTLTTLTPVLSATVNAVGTVFYTPYQGNVVPLYDGTVIQPTQFAELTNTLASATGGPAAGVQNANYDLFVWNNAGTLTLTRGPLWTKSATVTTPVASPGLVNWAGHGLAVGTPVSFSGGVLPTGIVAGTTYYVIAAGYTANVFEISATVGGAGINFTGSSSGTQTGTAGSDTVRSADTALVMTNGLLLNNVSITNGPPAQRGTYVGTIRTDSAGVTCSWTLGAVGTAGALGVWNAYNRVNVGTSAGENTATWNYNGTVRKMNNTDLTRVDMIRGLNEDNVYAHTWMVLVTAAVASTFGIVTVGIDGITGATEGRGQVAANSLVAPGTEAGAAHSFYNGLIGLGWHNVIGMEQGDGANNFATLANSLAAQGVAFRGKM